MPDGTQLLNLDPEKLRNEAGVCSDCSNELFQIGREIDSACDSIRDVWYGASSQKFTEILETSGIEAINKMGNFADLMSLELNSVADNLETLDNDTVTGYEG